MNFPMRLVFESWVFKFEIDFWLCSTFIECVLLVKTHNHSGTTVGFTTACWGMLVTRPTKEKIDAKKTSPAQIRNGLANETRHSPGRRRWQRRRQPSHCRWPSGVPSTRLLHNHNFVHHTGSSVNAGQPIADADVRAWHINAIRQMQHVVGRHLDDSLVMSDLSELHGGVDAAVNKKQNGLQPANGPDPIAHGNARHRNMSLQTTKTAFQNQKLKVTEQIIRIGT